jgi:hypothetical protein
MARVKIQLPLTYPDVRATAFRVYRLRGNPPATLVATVAIGTVEVIDDAATYGDAFYFTALDETSGNESGASPAVQIFRRTSMMPVNLKNSSGSVVIT